ncbi:Lipoprotein-releasing system ATP-binding protein LolD [Peptoniphilus harei]|uniref:ABC transporter ATP-binding protein n=1 Tax=Peptoniphilus harei TaxID=54005 RepID=A0A7T5ACY2_9FIRM|nr:ABC transporter ATP-binding protein [Peptoniphilus harei]MBS6535502.1 ABC transporter ATP-binding protein [Peptoniphilus harei]QQE46888.1 ABC transporter ATP-binding protein [Peptoniphilus harei]QQE47688.1 ABC transporter ATP-binding protein [Peptoniphilus harei]VEJ34922.1 Lipoprotein-releasing system ATP-binding protein LolD [Peptoniphilus harei]
MLKVENLKRYYKANDVEVRALDGVSFDVKKGEFISIIGASGSGKSTLLHLLGGLDYPTSGKVLIDDTDIYALKDDERTIFRRRNIGFVFQAYNLLPMLNVYENIIIPFGLDGDKVDKKYVDSVIDILEISDQKYKMPNELSGGQQQRVAIARALVTKPSLILADEPTGNLDSKSSSQVVYLLKKINKELGNTILMITHDDAVAQAAEKTLRIEDGKLVGNNESQK